MRFLNHLAAAAVIGVGAILGAHSNVNAAEQEGPIVLTLEEMDAVTAGGFSFASSRIFTRVELGENGGYAGVGTQANSNPGAANQFWYSPDAQTHVFGRVAEVDGSGSGNTSGQSEASGWANGPAAFDFASSTTLFEDQNGATVSSSSSVRATCSGTCGVNGVSSIGVISF